MTTNDESWQTLVKSMHDEIESLLDLLGNKDVEIDKLNIELGMYQQEVERLNRKLRYVMDYTYKLRAMLMLDGDNYDNTVEGT